MFSNETSRIRRTARRIESKIRSTVRRSYEKTRRFGRRVANSVRRTAGRIRNTGRKIYNNTKKWYNNKVLRIKASLEKGVKIPTGYSSYVEISINVDPVGNTKTRNI